MYRSLRRDCDLWRGATYFLFGFAMAMFLTAAQLGGWL